MSKLKRFYIKKVGDSISIYHRPSHQLIWSGKLNEEGREMIEKFINMGRDEFYSYVLDSKIDITPIGNFSPIKNTMQEQEDWLRGAWEYTTKQVLEYFNIDINSIPIEEEPTRDYLIRLKESLAGNKNKAGQRKKKLLKKKSSRPSILHELKRRNKKSGVKKVGKSPTKK